MKTAISLALAIGLLSTAAHADNLYFQADGGISHYGSNSLNGSGFDIDQALTVAGRVGKPLSFVRVEAEASLTFGTVDLEADAGEDDASYAELSGSIGVYKDVGPFYAGLGGGFAYQEISAEVFGVTVSDDTVDVIGHAEVGASVRLNDSLSIVPHYRATIVPGFDLDDEVVVHSARLGLRWGVN